MNDYEDCPTQDDHFNGLEEEIHSDEANKEFVHCDNCGELCHTENLLDGICEDCFDDQVDWELLYRDDY